MHIKTILINTVILKNDDKNKIVYKNERSCVLCTRLSLIHVELMKCTLLEKNYGLIKPN